MLEYLEPFKKVSFDCIMFVPGSKEDSIHIEGSDYTNKGEYLGGSDLGHSYHVLLYKHDEKNDDKVYGQDQFECILIDPLEYLSGLIPSGFFGMIAKKTTTSQEFVDRIFDKITKT